MKTYITPIIEVIDIKDNSIIATSDPTFGSGTTQSMDSKRRFDFFEESSDEDDLDE